MNLPFRNFTDIIRDMSSSITASTGRLIDLSTGSIFRAIIEANASIVLWIQWLILITLRTTRATTSAGAELDSWMADFSLSRVPANFSVGTVIFSRFSATLLARIPVGSVVKTHDGSVSFSVTEDRTNSSWNDALGAYILEVGIFSLRIPIRSVVPGQSGNVLANTITLMASPLLGIDFLNNDVETNGGGSPETDEEFRERFRNFFVSRSKATADAFGYAVSQVQRGLSYAIHENMDAQGRPRIGNILVLVDDGSGLLSTTLHTSLTVAIEGVRPVGTVVAIQPPEIMWVDIDITLRLTSEGVLSNVQSNVALGVKSFVDAIPIGGNLSISRIIQLVYHIESNIENISIINVNGQNNDIQAPMRVSLKLRNIYFHY